jgi:uncharacterized protein
VPHLDGCLDVDLEPSAMTTAFPVHRMGLAISARSEAPAAYGRAGLEQTYERTADEDSRLDYDESGLVLDYPGIATRVR